MNKEDFVSFKCAKRLKALGFDCDVNAYYNRYNGMFYEYWSAKNANSFDNTYSAPTLAQVCKWLREKHNIHIQIESVIGKKWTYDVVDIKPIQDISGEYISRMPERVGYPVINTYEQAQSEGIDVALEMLEETLKEQQK